MYLDLISATEAQSAWRTRVIANNIYATRGVGHDMCRKDIPGKPGRFTFLAVYRGSYSNNAAFIMRRIPIYNILSFQKLKRGIIKILRKPMRNLMKIQNSAKCVLPLYAAMTLDLDLGCCCRHCGYTSIIMGGGPKG